MLFSSVTFLYWFFPIFLILYFAAPKKIKNSILLFGSLFFYFWGEPIYTLLMFGTTLIGWVCGLLIEKYRGTAISKAALLASIIIGLGSLGVFKYSDFFIESLNSLKLFSLKTLGIALPIGISFYTFQILSYTIDLYRGNAAVQKSLINFGAYVSLFPQLIAGPIVRYTDVAEDLEYRTVTLEKISSGAFRFVVGLGKKVLVANVLGELCSIYKASDEKSVLFVWIYAIAYSLHIYFDFSGYSDMAIGLGRIMGFRFIENFNYPYISKSITEFWRRWHISLGTWFRDYVYIPLGGNRAKPARHIFNIFVVWFLTGFWHGAGWTFISWGIYFFIFLILEKYFLQKLFKKLPVVFSHIYTVIVLIFGWILFDAASMTEAFKTIGSMFGAGGLPFANTTTLYYLRSYGVALIAGLFGSLPLLKNLVTKLEGTKFGKAYTILEPVALVFILLMVTAYLIDGSYNPFIYFRF
ncbi:MAG: MBOAT family protein [Ruminococcaceae bacterium]|nr:MBOAT family protein [Oscillospiraceae bacterium]